MKNEELLEDVIYKIFKSKEYSNLESNPNAFGFMLAGAQEGAKWQQEQDKKCYHPMTERKHTSDVHFECTICGYNNY